MKIHFHLTKLIIPVILSWSFHDDRSTTIGDSNRGNTLLVQAAEERNLRHGDGDKFDGIGFTPISRSSTQERATPIDTQLIIDSCNLSLEIDCISSLVDGDCDSIPSNITASSCDDTPTQMIFRFLGGTCDQSMTIQQDGENFVCVDHADVNDGGSIGPSDVDGAQYYITAYSSEEASEVLYDGFATVGEELIFDASAGTTSGTFDSDTEIVIYSLPNNGSTNLEDIIGPSNIVQEMTFRSSCCFFGLVVFIIFI